MRRREFIGGIGGFAAWPLAAGAQPTRTYRILWLSTASSPDPLLDRFRDGLLSNGLVEGQNAVLDLQYAIDAVGLQPAIAELPRRDYDLVVSRGAQSIQATRLIKAIPVLFAISGDPVELGIAKSLARPGGNFTGATFLSLDLAAKRVELCKELLPNMQKLAVLSNTNHPGERSEWRVTQEAARSLGIGLVYIPFAGAGELDGALARVRAAETDAMLVFPDGVTYVHRAKIADLATKGRLPSMFGWRDYVEAGGLISYGPDQYATYFWLASYAARVLRGEKVGDLPIEQPTKFELIVNLKTATALALTIPPAVLIRADKVIE
jgi:putative tryptophan/tyrosine transport system substrate-binding protein